jgi:uncharacterized protein
MMARMANRLAGERSPYLQQHAGNPVDWYPWGTPAFEKAAAADRPIFLSIGYSTCHWCHVMAHESFENEEIANILNRDFVSIKIDREERPDVDRVYMTFVQATTGSGGWPLSVWLTPDLKPFYGGTYFPPESRRSHPGFADVLREIARVWRSDRSTIQASAEALTDRLRALKMPPGGDAVAGPDTLAEGVAVFAEAFDPARGGFGDAPKFPRPSELLFLLRESARTGDERPRLMSLTTLRAMAGGGVRDHLGGGFHRYSVDRDWRVPHFEKMLYDQAQLVLAYLEAAQATGDRVHADVAEDTLAYVRREMTAPEGGFYSAEDADSVPPEQADVPNARSREGAFYLWRDEEIGALPGEEADLFRRRFGILPDGNAPRDPQREFAGRNLLYVARSIDDVANATGRSPQAVEAALQRATRTLFEARLERPRPRLDDKVLTGWNGLMIAAFARAARVLGAGVAAASSREAHLRSARRAAEFLRGAMWDPDSGVLLRRYREGEAAIEAYAEDYADLVFGLIELFQADGDPGWLEWALTLQRRQDALFWDSADGGWFSTAGQDPTLILRLKDEHDGAEPSASSVSVLNLLSLAHLTGERSLFEKVERTLRTFGAGLGQSARAVPMMMAALSTYHAGLRQVAIVGPQDREDTLNLHREVAASYQPFSLIVPVEPGARQERLARILPFVAPLQMRDGRATAYVCRDFTCRQPVMDADGLRLQLSGAH